MGAPHAFERGAAPDDRASHPGQRERETEAECGHQGQALSGSVDRHRGRQQNEGSRARQQAAGGRQGQHARTRQRAHRLGEFVVMAPGSGTVMIVAPGSGTAMIVTAVLVAGRHSPPAQVRGVGRRSAGFTPCGEVPV
jgi:hypothetical protein